MYRGILSQIYFRFAIKGNKTCETLFYLVSSLRIEKGEFIGCRYRLTVIGLVQGKLKILNLIILSLRLWYSLLSSLISSSSCRLLWTNSKRRVLLVFQMSHFTFNTGLNIGTGLLDHCFLLVVIYAESILFVIIYLY